MNIELETLEVKTKIDGVEVVFKEPTVADYEKFIDDITKGVGDITAMTNFLCKLNVEKKIVKKMTLNQMKKLVKTFTEGK